jgi:phosphopantothenoylcysteine decarboxylase/phosphopantothenate--cysteine ligase
MTKKQASVILGVTGGIAAYRACEIISSLKKKCIDVTVLLTKEAEEFVTPLTFQTLSQNKVYRHLFSAPDEWNPVHTSLADKADLVLIAPATANVIGKVASGICDDILTCTIFATKAPVIFAPAMNEKMYQHKIVEYNIKKLKDVGYHFVGPVKGRLACGHEAIGHIADTQEIVGEAIKILKWD